MGVGYQIFSLVGIPLAVAVVLGLLLLAARPDRGRAGVYATYLALASVVSLYLLLLLGVTTLVAVLTGAFVEFPHANDPQSVMQGLESTFSVFGSTTSNDSAKVLAAAAGAGTLAAGGFFVFHRRRHAELAAEDESATARVGGAYAGAVCTTAISFMVGALLMVGLGAIQLAAPDLLGGSEDYQRDSGLVNLLGYGTLAVVALALFHSHFGSLHPVDDAERPVEAGALD